MGGKWEHLGDGWNDDDRIPAKEWDRVEAIRRAEHEAALRAGAQIEFDYPRHVYVRHANRSGARRFALKDCPPPLPDYDWEQLSEAQVAEILAARDSRA